MPAKRKAKKPVVVFCELRRPPDEIVNISSQNGAEGVVTRMLPKSHVSHVILNANVSEERFLDMKVSTENKMQRKSKDVHNHFINTFIKRLERKQQRWMREDEYVSKNFQLSAPGRGKTQESNGTSGPLTLPTPPQPQVLYKKAKYPYMSVGRLPGFGQQHSRKETLPRIQTVPVGRARPTANQPPIRVKLPAPRPPNSEDQVTWNGATSNQRADTASTIATRMTGGTRGKRKVAKNYDSRFTELLTWLSPVDAKKGPMFSRSKVMFGMSQPTY
ncbi:unnamed protein product [Clavelina lepadiformis]|uniref:Uncharacterized protein n=1 Tax=Clavelina lepadiformis TaxID=159417 RepID=A0ABP0FK02_CLALP